MRFFAPLREKLTKRTPCLTSFPRLLFRLQLFAANLFLAIALRDAKLERLVLRPWRELVVLGAAPITDHRVADPEEQGDVEQRCAAENDPGPQLLVIQIGDERDDAGDGENRQAERVGEVLL